MDNKYNGKDMCNTSLLVISIIGFGRVIFLDFGDCMYMNY